MIPGRILHTASLATVRGFSLLAKFLLMLYMASFLDYRSIGILGLFQSSVVIFTKIAGLGLYFSFNRQLPSLAAQDQRSLVRRQYTIYLLVYGVLASLILIGAQIAQQPMVPILVFIVIACLEHLLFECSQTLFALQRPMAANLVYCGGTSFWVLVAVIAGLLQPGLRTLQVILGAWLTGLIVVTLCIGIAARTWIWKPEWNPWSIGRCLIESFAKSSVLMVAMTAATATLFVDRYLIAEINGLTDTGVYTFLWSFSNAVQTLVLTSIHVVATPKLVQYFHRGEGSLLRLEVKALVANVLGLVAPGCFLMWFSLRWLAPHLNQDMTIIEHLDTFALMLVAVFLRVLAEIGANVLYASNQDRRLLLHWLSLLTLACIFHVVLIPLMGIKGAAIANISMNLIALCLHGQAAMKILGYRHSGASGEKVRPDPERRPAQAGLRADHLTATGSDSEC
jgi:O-antigen/teichoic acid export membrane protein